MDKSCRDLVFLKGLEKRLHSFKEISSQVYGRGEVDEFTDKKISERTLIKILKIAEINPNLIFTPVQGHFGFAPVYVIYQIDQPIVPGIPVELKHILTFDGKQLPDEWDFEKLSVYFNSEENLRRMDFVDFCRPGKKSDYEY